MTPHSASALYRAGACGAPRFQDANDGQERRFMPTITLENVTKYYKIDRKRRKLEKQEKRYEMGVEDINLTIEQGEFEIGRAHV